MTEKERGNKISYDHSCTHFMTPHSVSSSPSLRSHSSSSPSSSLSLCLYTTFLSIFYVILLAKSNKEGNGGSFFDTPCSSDRWVSGIGKESDVEMIQKRTFVSLSTCYIKLVCFRSRLQSRFTFVMNVP